jgi:RNA polymerase sigma factor (sigma-70 family)
MTDVQGLRPFLALHTRAPSAHCTYVVRDGVVRSGLDQIDLENVWRGDGARIWRAVAAYACDAEIANDAVSEAFAQALGRADEIRDPLPWLWRTSFRLAAKELRARRRADTPRREGSYELPEPLDDVFRAFGRLSPNQRAAVPLHDYADRPTAEVARTLGMSPATVRVHLSQRRRRLRRLLEERRDD